VPYQANGDLGRAASRLALLGDPDPGAALVEQANRSLRNSNAEEAVALLTLAEAIGERVVYPTLAADAPLPATTETVLPAGRVTPTRRPSPDPDPQSSRPPPRPTLTPTPTPGAYFVVITQEEVCNPALPPGLLQIEVQDAARQPIAGMEIIITWTGGQERLFTRPEAGTGQWLRGFSHVSGRALYRTLADRQRSRRFRPDRADL
jgi:hypothetical protein